MTTTHHQTYKRDQVERAIAMCSSVPPKGDPAGFKGLKIELKRLLDRDRKQAEETNSYSVVRWAFHHAPPPGRGVDVIYTHYEAFALLIALRLLRGGLPQSTAVDFVRDVRAPLEGAHYEIIQKSLREYEDKMRLSDVRLVELARDGLIAQDIQQMAHLVTFAGRQARTLERPTADNKWVSGNICRDLGALQKTLFDGSQQAHPTIAIELVNPAHQLSYHLSRFPARSRGRG